MGRDVIHFITRDSSLIFMEGWVPIDYEGGNFVAFDIGCHLLSSGCKSLL